MRKQNVGSHGVYQQHQEKPASMRLRPLRALGVQRQDLHLSNGDPAVLMAELFSDMADFSQDITAMQLSLRGCAGDDLMLAPARFGNVSELEIDLQLCNTLHDLCALDNSTNLKLLDVSNYHGLVDGTAIASVPHLSDW